VRDQLRAATMEIHQALHHAAPFAAIAAGTMDKTGYGALLQVLHRYHSHMAPFCDAGARALGAPALAVAHQTRIMTLEADLSHLGLPQQNGTDFFPGANDTGRDTPSFGAGCLYTVQGSTLGGKVIYRQLDDLLPGLEGRRFFRGAPSDAADWQALCAGLERSGADLTALTQGAHFAFACFAKLLP
jgi:heme oxygenase